jgi:hypothetical protein
MVQEHGTPVTSLFRPLHLVEQLTEEMGTEITYAYDDLVFFEYPDVVLQFDNVADDRLHLFINHTLDADTRENIRENWLQVARTKHITLLYKGTFSIEQHPVKEEISIQFF